MRFILLLAFVAAHLAFAQSYTGAAGEVKFFSATPVENIDAKSQQLKSALNLDSKALAFVVALPTFKFKKQLMQQHFNGPDYLDTQKPENKEAKFKGTLITTEDLKKVGRHAVKAKGTFTLHNVAKEREFDGILETRADGSMFLTSAFKVSLADHNINIPKVVFKQIAEVVDVNVATALTIPPAAPKN